MFKHLQIAIGRRQRIRCRQSLNQLRFWLRIFCAFTHELMRIVLIPQISMGFVFTEHLAWLVVSINNGLLKFLVAQKTNYRGFAVADNNAKYL